MANRINMSLIESEADYRSEEEFMKAVADNNWMIFSQKAVGAFHTDLQKAMAESNAVTPEGRNVILKAMKDYGKLQKKIIVDKNGTKRTVYVKRQEAKAAKPEGKGKPEPTAKDKFSLESVKKQLTAKLKADGNWDDDMEDDLDGAEGVWLVDEAGMKKISDIFEDMKGGNDSEVYYYRNMAKEEAEDLSIDPKKARGKVYAILHDGTTKGDSAWGVTDGDWNVLEMDAGKSASGKKSKGAEKGGKKEGEKEITRTLNQTTTHFLQGKIEHCGNAGEFSQEAFDFVNASSEEDIKMAGEAWSDIMYFPSTGEVIAIVAEGELTSNSDANYVYLDEKDCPAAFEGRDAKELS